MGLRQNEENNLKNKLKVVLIRPKVNEKEVFIDYGLHWFLHSLECTKWFALANLFSHSIDIDNFLDANTVQGTGVYVWNGTDWSAATATGEIKPFQGFFVNMTSGDATIDFHLKDLFYVAPAVDATPANNDYVTLDVVTDGYPVAVKIAHNDAALTEYDIFDADKMFGSGAVAEPYFVSNGKYLCKEEINANSYTAAMNIKSSEARDVQIVASNIPEG